MAVYESEANKLIVRVVYDGPGRSGKTTNLEKMCEFFSKQRRSELFTGATAAARTLYLDWLQLDGGLVAGHDLRCHLVSVPGQAVLSRRRQMLLNLADATVFVLDSTEAGLTQAYPMWRSMLETTGGPKAGIPAVLQANKQDQPGALSPEEIRRRWEIVPEIPIVAAEAAAGRGVRETVVLAIRSTAILLQDTLLTRDIHEMMGSYEDGAALEKRMREQEALEPMSPVDVFVAAQSTHREVVNDGNVPIPFKPANGPIALPLPSGSARLKQGAAAEEGPPPAQEAQCQEVLQDAHKFSLESADLVGCLPRSNVPSGLVWPASEGRRTLMRVPRTEAHILGRVQSGASRKADEKSEQIFVEAGIWCLTTNRQRCFATVEAAGKELVQLARLKMNIGAFRAPRTVLAVQKYKSHYWLWTVSLWLTSLGSQLDDASRAGDETRLEEALCIYAKVLVRALRLKVDKDLRLRLEPRRFGLLCGEAFYLPDQMDTGGEFWGAGSAVLRRFDEYQRLPGALRGYQRALEQDLVKNFSHEELQQLDLVAELAAFVPHSFAANVAQKQLISVLSCEVRVVAS